MNSIITPKYTSLILKTVGVIFTISALVDFITLSIPIRLSQSNWQVQFVSNVVDRGIVPLLGFLLFILGCWIHSTVEPISTKKKKKGLDLKLIIFVICVILSVCYIIVIPIHTTNINKAKRTTLASINQQAQASEAEIQQQYTQLQQFIIQPQTPEKLEQGIQQIDQILNSGQQINEEQRINLEQERQRLVTYQSYVKDPKLLENQLTNMQDQLDKSRLEKVTETNLESVKQITRTGLNSLLLAIAYSIIGWVGLKNLLRTNAKSTELVQ